MLLDANVLLFAVDADSRFHARAAAWLDDRLNGNRRVGFPWPTLLAFIRLSTHPRAASNPLGPSEAWRYVEDWLASDVAWIPLPTERHGDILGGLIATHEVRGNLITDAHLAAIAIEHGLKVCSADTDFARFTEIGWENPLAA